MFNNFFNDPIIKQLSEAYLEIINEAHTEEELKQSSTEELKALISEYSDKVEAAKDEEEAEKHRKELQMIRDILKSREETKDEDNEDTEKEEENDK
jgi:hypothetical protein